MIADQPVRLTRKAKKILLSNKIGRETYSDIVERIGAKKDESKKS